MIDRCSFSTKSVLHDFQADGVVHLELRTTPRAIVDAGVTKDDYVRIVLGVLEEHNQDEKNPMRAFLILSVDRRNSPEEAEQVVDLALKYQSAGVVGIDLCGDPSKGDIRIFTAAFARAKAAGLNITLHFAEVEASATDEELNTLLSWKPDRLGHVIQVKDEFKERIEKDNIALELCLSCNVHAKMITGTFGDHHFGMWRYTNVPLALCVCARHACSAKSNNGRRTMLAFSSALSPKSTISPQIISAWDAPSCWNWHGGPFPLYLLVPRKKRACKVYLPIGHSMCKCWRRE